MVCYLESQYPYGRNKRRSFFKRRLAILALGLVPLARASFGQISKERYRDIVLQIQQRIEQHELNEAESLLVRAQREFPADGGLDNLLGVIEIQRRLPDRAIAAFSAAIAHAPGLTSAYLNLGRIYTESAEQDRHARTSALHVYEELLRREPDNAEADYQMALLLMWDQSYQRSLKKLERLSEVDRGRLSAQMVICADQAALGNTDAANKAAALVIAAPDFTERDGLVVLPTLRIAHRADLIELVFAAANARTPLSPAGLRILGLAQEGTDELAAARATLEGAFAQSQSSVPILIDLTRIAKTQKDYQGALGYLAHARDLQPDDAAFAYEFGVLTIRMGLLGEARKAMGDAVRLAPDNPEYNFGMGIVSSFSQDATQGLSYLMKYHALRPSDSSALLAIGTAYYRSKNFEDASTWLKQAANHAATVADAHYYLGRIARVRGQFDLAKQELEQANLLEPDRPDVLAELGQVFTATREYARADGCLDHAVMLEPENYAANFGLLQLYAREGDPRKEEQSKRFETIKSKSEEQYKEMMRIISARADGSSGG